MKTKIIQIGNSKGIRIPRILLEQSGLDGEVELAVEKEQIIIKTVRKPRQGWDKAFQTMADNRDDQILDKKELTNQSHWDKDEWEW